MKILLSHLLIIVSVFFVCTAIRCNFSYKENVDNYPEREINRIVARKKVLFPNNTITSGSQFLCRDENDDDDKESVEVPYRLNFNHNTKNARPSFRKPVDHGVDMRFGTSDSPEISKEAPPHFDDDEEVFSDPLCPSFKSRIFPKILPNLLNKMVVVVNHGKFRQEVVIEKCSNATQPCNFSDNFPFSVITKCKQKYLTQTVKVLNEDDQKIIDESVYFPSGCECRIYSGKKKSTTSSSSTSLTFPKN